MTALVCKAVECENIPVPGKALCDYHLDMHEDGIKFPLKGRGRPRLDETIPEKAAKFLGMKDRAAALNRKLRGIKPPTPGELAAKLDLRRARDRARNRTPKTKSA